MLTDKKQIPLFWQTFESKRHQQDGPIEPYTRLLLEHFMEMNVEAYQRGYSDGYKAACKRT